MKKLLFALLALTMIGLVSCTKDSSTKPTTKYNVQFIQDWPVSETVLKGSSVGTNYDAVSISTTMEGCILTYQGLRYVVYPGAVANRILICGNGQSVDAGFSKNSGTIVLSIYKYLNPVPFGSTSYWKSLP